MVKVESSADRKRKFEEEQSQKQQEKQKEISEEVIVIEEEQEQDDEDQKLGERLRSTPRMKEAFKSFGDYMHAKINKLDEQFEAERAGPLQSEIFKSVAIHITGHTVPSFTELKQIMQEHGGKFYHYYDSSAVTHVVASNLSKSRSRDLKGKKVVKPEWIVESVKAGKLLNWMDYRLEHVHLASHTNLGVNPITKYMINEKKSLSKTPQKVQEEEVVIVEERKSDTPVKTTDPNFVNSYFQTSRLHHLSAWKQELQKYTFRNGKPGKKKLIMHVDMDCFFASVAVLNNKELEGKPVGVSHGQGMGGLKSSDVASCNYIARKFGVKNGMLIGEAKRLCKDLVIVGYEFEKYKRAAYDLYSVLLNYPNALEAVSCDEALLEFTIGTEVKDAEQSAVNCKIPFQKDRIVDRLQNDILTIAQLIQMEIYAKTQLVASIGIGESVLAAKIATKRAKPEGIYYLNGKEELANKMKSMRIRDLPGIGWSFEERVNKIIARKTTGIDTVEFEDGDEDEDGGSFFDKKPVSRITCTEVLQVFRTAEEFKREFGSKQGQKLYATISGIDNKIIAENAAPRGSEHQNDLRKTVSAEVNWGVRFSLLKDLEEFVQKLLKEVVQRASSNENDFVTEMQKITVILNFRHKDAPYENQYKFLGCGMCETVTKSVKLQSHQKYTADDLYTETRDTIINSCKDRFEDLFPNEKLSLDKSTLEIRGLGFTLTRGAKTVSPPAKKIASKQNDAVKSFFSPAKRKQEDLNEVNNKDMAKGIKMQQIELERWNKLRDKQKKTKPIIYLPIPEPPDLMKEVDNIRDINDLSTLLMKLIDDDEIVSVNKLRRYYVSCASNLDKRQIGNLFETIDLILAQKHSI
jgi:nucleotidyltransferase/DNA polymerase involved in DNA repair